MNQIEIQIIASLVAASCAIPGVFLLLRRVSMMSDAISHSILVGIVIAFLFIGNLASPLLVIGAAMSGVLTVLLIEAISRKSFVSEDASIGLVFPFFFSIGVVLISLFTWDVHIDADCVLFGEIAFAPFDRLYISGVNLVPEISRVVFGSDISRIDLGPKSVYVIGATLIINIIFITVFYKELKLTTFDPGLAASFHFMPNLLNLGLMTVVSITCVGAFESVGSILVVAFIIVPPACAYLMTDSLLKMIILSVLIGILCSVTGFWFSQWVDASISGSMAVMAGLIFAVVFVVAPEKGLLSRKMKEIKQEWEFAHDLLLVHLFNHEGSPEYIVESKIDHLHEHMLWGREFGKKVVNMAMKRGNIVLLNDHLELTGKGRKIARESADVT